MQDQLLYLYPVWLRMWHAINAICIIGLVLTGISLQYSDIKYPFIPFDIAITWHNIFGVITVVSYLGFIVGNGFSSNGKQYRIQLAGLAGRLAKQAKYYVFGYFRGGPKPFPINKDNKFNPLQRLSYTGTMYFLIPLVIVTGIALLYPEIIIERFFMYSGIQLTALLHAAVGFFLSLFFIIHVYVASVGKHPLKNYRSMINGFHEVE